jgi:predicted signal transduction protein with EAL and GGDEF domain
VDRHEIVTSVSMGIALSSHGYLHPEDLIRDADTAMYRAKAEGKARHRVFDHEMHEDAVSRLNLEADLRRAVLRDEFAVHYQPIVNLATGLVEGFEALVRWEHPERGLVYPDEFIPVAEETGMINAVGWMVLRQACKQTMCWTRDFPDREPLRISVNLSARQLHQSELVRGVVSILTESGLAPEALRLEITETALMEAAEKSNRVLGALRDHGIRVAIDDFGTGYSSLNYLHDFEIDGLKIDRSFIGRIQPEVQVEIVQTILDLGRNLGMTVIAEGVETHFQLARLRELNCPYGQGYLFARPLDETAATRLLANAPRW